MIILRRVNVWIVKDNQKLVNYTKEIKMKKYY